MMARNRPVSKGMAIMVSKMYNMQKPAYTQTRAKPIEWPMGLRLLSPGPNRSRFIAMARIAAMKTLWSNTGAPISRFNAHWEALAANA